MNSRERVRQALLCEKPDRIPKALGFYSPTLPQIKPAQVDDYFHLDVRFAEFDPPKGQDSFLDYLSDLPKDVYLGNKEQIRTYHEWDYHPELGSNRPLSGFQSVAELADYVFPDLTDPARYAGLSFQVEEWHRQGFAVAGSPPHLGGQLFETAWRLRGFENFMIDLIKRPDIARYLLDKLTPMIIHSALILAESDVDILLLDDDVAMRTNLMISPDTWREYFKPRLSDIINLARDISPDILIFYHSDGNFTQIIPDLVEIGVNVINPVQPDCMDAHALKLEYGDRLAMWGTVGTAWAWDKGTPDQIRVEVEHRIKTLGPQGLLIAPAYDIDFTPLENLIAFVEAVETFGRV